MKNVLILLLMVASLAAISQPNRKIRHVILIRNNYTGAIRKISENSDITIITRTGQKILGRIDRIQSDTIFFRDTFVKVTEIKTLVSNGRTSSPSMPGPFRHEQRPSGFEYDAGLPDKQIICPPASAYQSNWSYHVYVKSLIREVKKARNEEFNPLQETANPLLEKNTRRMDTVYAASDTGNLLSDAKIPRTSRLCRYNNFLKWNVTKLAHLEIAFAYERMIADKVTWETELSAIFGVQSADAHYMLQQPLYNYNGFSVTTYPKYYIISPTAYLSMVFMYRYLWATGIRTNWPDKGGNGELQDQYRNDYGLSLRIGIMRRYGIMVVDFYVGGGIKYITVHQLAYGSYLYHDSDQMQWYNEDHSPVVKNQVLFGPVINAGIKIGVAF